MIINKISNTHINTKRILNTKSNPVLSVNKPDSVSFTSKQSKNDFLLDELNEIIKNQSYSTSFIQDGRMVKDNKTIEFDAKPYRYELTRKTEMVKTGRWIKREEIQNKYYLIRYDVEPLQDKINAITDKDEKKNYIKTFLQKKGGFCIENDMVSHKKIELKEHEFEKIFKDAKATAVKDSFKQEFGVDSLSELLYKIIKDKKEGKNDIEIAKSHDSFVSGYPVLRVHPARDSEGKTSCTLLLSPAIQDFGSADMFGVDGTRFSIYLNWEEKEIINKMSTHFKSMDEFNSKKLW